MKTGLRRALSAGAALVALTTVVILVGAQKSAPFTLTISASRNSIPAGRGLEISVLLANTSHTTVFTRPTSRGDDEGDWLYDVEVTGPGGKPAPRTRFKLVMSSAVCCVVNVAPGASFRVGILITRRFDITLPGNYSIRACADWRGTPVGVHGKPNMPLTVQGKPKRLIGVYPRVCSNTITVTVTY